MGDRIAIVGGGYMGAELAQALDGVAEVTLIEQNSHAVHAVAMIRALVQPHLLDKALLPYDRLLKRGKVVHARAVAVDGQGVTLEGGGRVQADWIVLATGSSNGPAFKPGAGGIEGFRAAHARIGAQIAAAKRIVIVGAGPVGTELAGEIAHFLPGKQVTLVSADATLFPMMPAKLGTSLLAKLGKAGVEVILGARAEDLQSLTEPYAGRLRLSTGRVLDADLIIPAIGSRANSDLAAALPGAVKTTANRVRADGWMRPSTLPNVFALGDAADLGDAMTIVGGSRQMPWLAKALKALVGGAKVESLKPYTPWPKGKAPLLVPLGPTGGSSFLSLFTAGDFLTRAIKGKTVFIPKYRKRFGLA